MAIARTIDANAYLDALSENLTMRTVQDFIDSGALFVLIETFPHSSNASGLVGKLNDHSEVLGHAEIIATGRTIAEGVYAVALWNVAHEEFTTDNAHKLSSGTGGHHFRDLYNAYLSARVIGTGS